MPALKDFDRLDARFRMPSGVWDALPGYADWGFCVFKLRQTTERGLVDRLLGQDTLVRRG